MPRRILSLLYQHCIDQGPMAPHRLVRLCNLSFGGLVTVQIREGTTVPAEGTSAVQRLLSLPIIRTVEVNRSPPPVGLLSTESAQRFPKQHAHSPKDHDTSVQYGRNTRLKSWMPYGLDSLAVFERLAQLDVMIIGPNPQSAFRVIQSIHPHSRVCLRAFRFRLTNFYALDDSFRIFLSVCPELSRKLSEVRDQFPNVSIVHISAFVPTPVLTMGAKHYFPLLDRGISVQWDFGGPAQAPWYKSLV
ncbi:hypothetical protein FB451DRAFT_1188646 [Mycena latifolia]|nr:hypothetical protein FB451DRAFT_1188646 [Mycena latifolia]